MNFRILHSTMDHPVTTIFSHFDAMPQCDRHKTTAYTMLSIASRSKNELASFLWTLCIYGYQLMPA